MKVESIREHVNTYGNKPKKTVGTEYDLPENMAATLIDAGLVKEVAEKAPKAK
jgi:hypothetical protein